MGWPTARSLSPLFRSTTCWRRWCDRAELAGAFRSDRQHRRPGGNRLTQLFAVDLVERVVGGVMDIEIAHAVLGKRKAGGAACDQRLDIGTRMARLAAPGPAPGQHRAA